MTVITSQGSSGPRAAGRIPNPQRQMGIIASLATGMGERSGRRGLRSTFSDLITPLGDYLASVGLPGAHWHQGGGLDIGPANRSINRSNSCAHTMVTHPLAVIPMRRWLPGDR